MFYIYDADVSIICIAILLFHNHTTAFLLKNISIANNVQLPCLIYPNHDILIIRIVHGREVSYRHIITPPYQSQPPCVI